MIVQPATVRMELINNEAVSCSKKGDRAMVLSKSGLAVEFCNVYAGYRGSKTLTDISLRVESGQIVGIAGQNGSGKTTLLRVIQGLLPTSSGSASVLGHDLVTSNYADIRRRTACVFQTLNVDPRMPITAGEVVLMGRYGRIGLFRGPRQSDRDASRQALEKVDALHLIDRPFGQLSGGEQQRINLARALAQEPDLLLLDEPTTFLDVKAQQTVRDIIKSVHDECMLTTIIVSHDSNMLASMCNRIIVMQKGRIREVVLPGGYARV